MAGDQLRPGLMSSSRLRDLHEVCKSTTMPQDSTSEPPGNDANDPQSNQQRITDQKNNQPFCLAAWRIYGNGLILLLIYHQKILTDMSTLQLVCVVTALLTAALITSPAAGMSTQQVKSSAMKTSTPDPSRFVVRDGSVFDMAKKKTVFFKGIGYSPYLPGETPLQGASPGEDGRYQEHLALVDAMGANYLHVFPSKMPADFFNQLDSTNIVYGQDIWMFPYAEDFLDEEYLAWKWSIIKNAIDHTYAVGRPDRLVLFSIGDELQAESVARTDRLHPNVRNYKGKHVVATNRTPTEIALAGLIDKAIEYELTTYGRRHLYCHTSWTHIGPLADRTDLEVPETSVLLPDLGDLMCLNVYSYARGVVTSPPGSVTGSTYQGYIEELAASTDKPVFITQVGMSTSPIAPKSWVPGFGGHKIEEVSSSLRAIWQDLHTARGRDRFCGISFFELHDEWWKSGEDPADSASHEREDPEEWFGLYEVSPDKHLVPKGGIPETIKSLFTTPMLP